MKGILTYLVVQAGLNYKLQAISVGQNLWFYISLITTGKAF